MGFEVAVGLKDTPTQFWAEGSTAKSTTQNTKPIPYGVKGLGLPLPQPPK